MKMERKKQNLILFYEENNDEKDISSKLVRLYMNRFLIGEEDQSELSGVYDLAQNTQPNEDTPLVEFSSIWNQKESKRNGFGKTVFLKSVSKIFESEKMANQSRGPQFVNSYKIHFIVGTSWNINASALKRILLQNIIKSMIKQAWQTDQNKEFGVRKVSNVVTLLRGSHRNLLTTEQLKSTHLRSKDGEELINDDLEYFYKHNMASTKLSFSEKVKCLSFYKQLTDIEVEKLKPFQYEIGMTEQDLKTPQSLEALLPLFEKTDRGYQHLQCDCQRFSFPVKFKV